MPTYLVTGATGQQGSGAVTHLLAAGYTVHAFTRDPSSPAAQALVAKGVKLFQGHFDNPAALVTAARGCNGAFLSVPSSFGSLREEYAHGLNAITAAKSAGVKHIVYPTVCGLTTPEERGISRDHPNGAYFANKTDLEKAVKDAGFETWTILRPGGFATNFLVPGSAFMCPELPTEGILKTAVEPSLVIPWVVPSDIGKFVAAAFADPGRFRSKTVDIAGEDMTMAEYLAVMSKVAGKQGRVHYWSKEDVDAMNGANPLAVMQLNQNRFPQRPNLEEVRSWGVKMTTVEEFFLENKERVEKSIGGPKIA